MTQKQISLEKIYEILLKLDAKMKKMDQYIEDLEFVRRTAEAWESYDRGEFKTVSVEKFREQLKKC